MTPHTHCPPAPSLYIYLSTLLGSQASGVSDITASSTGRDTPERPGSAHGCGAQGLGAAARDLESKDPATSSSSNTRPNLPTGTFDPFAHISSYYFLNACVNHSGLCAPLSRPAWPPPRCACPVLQAARTAVSFLRVRGGRAAAKAVAEATFTAAAVAAAA